MRAADFFAITTEPLPARVETAACYFNVVSPFTSRNGSRRLNVL